jgi:hypothetical protein
VRRDLTNDQRVRLAKAIRDEVAPRVLGTGFDKLDRSAVGKALGAKPSTISRLLGPHPVGGSLHLVDAVARFLNIEKDLILDGVAKEHPVPRLRDLPGYKEARLTAERRIQEDRMAIDQAALERAADVRVTPAPASVNANVLIGLASALTGVGDESTSKMRVGKRHK